MVYQEEFLAAEVETLMGEVPEPEPEPQPEPEPEPGPEPEPEPEPEPGPGREVLDAPPDKATDAGPADVFTVGSLIKK